MSSFYRRPVVIVVGQIPPPMGGQNVMIEKILAQLKRQSDWQVEHLPMNFNTSFTQIRRFSGGKLIELVRVFGRLLRIRVRGRAAVIIYPFGGKHLAPMVRDICLIPLLRVCGKKIVVWFHTGGIAEKLPEMPLPFHSLHRSAFKNIDAAVVMTAFNSCDPIALDIKSIHIIPHTIEDRFKELAEPITGAKHLLYLGHLYPDKGVPQLLEAFNLLAVEMPDLILDLVGEPVAPWSKETIESLIKASRHGDRIRWHGLALGEVKDRFFQNADVFVFPSIAPGESFGLVLAEALMWGLPIVATDWRGNSDVLTDVFFGALVDANPLTGLKLADAIRSVLKSDVSKIDAFEKNRQIYLENYCFELNKNRIPSYVRSLLQERLPA